MGSYRGSFARVTRDTGGELSESSDGLGDGESLALGVSLVGKVVQDLLDGQDVDVGVTTVDDLERAVGQVAVKGQRHMFIVVCYHGKSHMQGVIVKYSHAIIL